MYNTLENLRKFTTVVADSGDFESIKKFKPQDATTNPSLILKAAKDEKFSYLIDQSIASAKSNIMHDVIDNLLVRFGCEILNVVPGRVSTEVDATLSFDTESTVARANNIIKLYEKNGVSRERILIKIAATWEGILAARELEKAGIRCNLTLLFSDVQAIACADAGVKLISPFVGRILDWYKKNTQMEYNQVTDPGVVSVGKIYNYYKHFGYKTEIMGASFRNIGEIIELAGCDLLTISPTLLEELQNSDVEISKKLSVESAINEKIERKIYNEKTFRFEFNENQMAVEKLSEGIRLFVKDTIALEKIISERL